MYYYCEDENKLSHTDRLGLAYCRLNGWEWDSIVGEKPEGFDSMPNYDHRKFRRFRKKIKTKYEYLTPVMKQIERIIGEPNTSRCWWIFVLGRTEQEWFDWYVNERPKWEA